MSDHDALLAAVIANPDDDTPRLVMADWFQENGQSDRADFIRTQVKYACAGDRERRALRRCIEELWDVGTDAGGFLELPGFWGAPYWSRGFVWRVCCTAENWLAHANAMYWHPSQNRPCPPTAQPIREVALTTWPKLSVHSVNTGRSVERYFVFDGFGFTERSQLVAELYRRHDSRIEFELPPGPIGVVSLASSDRGDNVFEGLIMLAE